VATPWRLRIRTTINLVVLDARKLRSSYSSVMAALTLRRSSLPIIPLLLVYASCSGEAGPGPGGELPTGGTGATGGTQSNVSGSGGSGGSDATSGTGGTGGTGIPIPVPDGGTPPQCETTTCAALGFACGYLVDECGTMINCEDEGLKCGPLEICQGGVDGPTECVSGLGGEPCGLCSGVKDCSAAAQPTRLSGRVVTPGRDDANVENQVGVPNAFVYILRDNDATKLPPIGAGIPSGGTSCDRCEDQDLGPVLAGAVTDASGNFTIEGNVPVGMEFVLVVKAGRFRRAVPFTLPETAACMTTMLPTTLPGNPTRLPRTMSDGVAVNIPRIAVTTGRIDAMECVLEKMGVAHTEFGNPGAAGDAAPRVHIYRGGPNTINPRDPEDPPLQSGARIDDMTPHDTALYGDAARMQSYDIVLADCESDHWDSQFEQRDENGASVLEYVNRGGRFFASHLSFTWLHENGEQVYDEANALTTGLGPAATWHPQGDSGMGRDPMGLAAISVGRPQASPRIESFADWMVNERITTEAATPPFSFPIVDLREQNMSIGTSSEEFVIDTLNDNVQQFSFNTPYAAPEAANCGRVAYSSFHVSIGDTTEAIFPEHCVASGNLTAQEKVLLYMLFDLSACVGEPPIPPECTPTTCEEVGAECGYTGDGCGKVLDCGPCSVPPPR
jgi:hypothetical protein